MEQLYAIINNSWNWNAIGALGTWAIGIGAGLITWKQFQIEKHKKDDFLFQHRMNVYSDFHVITEKMLEHIAEIRKVSEIITIYDRKAIGVTGVTLEIGLINEMKASKLEEKLSDSIMDLLAHQPKVTVLFTKRLEILKKLYQITGAITKIRDKIKDGFSKGIIPKFDEEINLLDSMFVGNLDLENLYLHDLTSWADWSKEEATKSVKTKKSKN